MQFACPRCDYYPLLWTSTSVPVPATEEGQMGVVRGAFLQKEFRGVWAQRAAAVGYSQSLCSYLQATPKENLRKWLQGAELRLTLLFFFVWGNLCPSVLWGFSRIRYQFSQCTRTGFNRSSYKPGSQYLQTWKALSFCGRWHLKVWGFRLPRST